MNMAASVFRAPLIIGVILGVSLIWVACGKEDPVCPDIPSPAFNGILYAARQIGTEDFDIYIMDESGSNSKILVDTKAKDFSLQLSPIDNTLVFACGLPGNVDIFTVAFNDNIFSQITNHDSTDQHPDWSPDGLKIVFESSRAINNNYYDIYTMNANGTGLSVLAGDPSINEGGPDWSPDGSMIAFQYGWGHTADIRIVTIAGDSVAQFGHPDYGDGSPSWSPDGSKIACSYHDYNAGDWEIAVYDWSTGALIWNTQNDVFDNDPCWSPDGNKIAFTRGSNTLDSCDIWIINADGSNPVKITQTPDLDEQTPSWIW